MILILALSIRLLGKDWCSFVGENQLKIFAGLLFPDLQNCAVAVSLIAEVTVISHFKLNKRGLSIGRLRLPEAATPRFQQHQG